jgi:hypothetical protein
MGMFDNIKCEHPLPDGFDDNLKRFQTKSLDCELATYTITKDGKLVCDVAGQYGTERGEVPNFTGEIEFYTSNWCGSGAGYIMTDDDQPYWSRTYVAKFVNGKLIEINGGLEPARDDLKHVLRADFDKTVTPLVEASYAKGAAEKHQKAMELADKAELCTDDQERKRLFAEAAALEGQAANWSREEPSYTVLTRSAMSLAMSAGNIVEVFHRLGTWHQMQRCCGTEPPKEIVREMAQIIRQIADDLEK